MHSKQPNLATLFTSRGDSKKLFFRYDATQRDTLIAIEMMKKDDSGDWSFVGAFRPKEEDLMAMALTLLGVSRVTDEVEQHANKAASTRLAHSSEDLLRYAVINLRAAMIVKQREEGETSKGLEEAYNLYKLSYPNSDVALDEFRTAPMRHHWISTLATIRKDPTKLGAL